MLAARPETHWSTGYGQQIQRASGACRTLTRTRRRRMHACHAVYVARKIVAHGNGAHANCVRAGTQTCARSASNACAHTHTRTHARAHVRREGAGGVSDSRADRNCVPRGRHRRRRRSVSPDAPGPEMDFAAVAYLRRLPCVQPGGHRVEEKREVLWREGGRAVLPQGRTALAGGRKCPASTGEISRK